MESAKKIAFWLIIAIGLIFILSLWMTTFQNGKNNNDILKSLSETLTTAIPLIVITWVIGKGAEKATNLGNYTTQSELCLKELECWAQEMFVCTTDHNSTDYKIVTEQATAGVKYASIRHMLTRHGKDSTTTDTLFPGVIIRAHALTPKDVLGWKKRFAKAVMNYMQWYKILEGLDYIEFPYKNSFAGLLNQELELAYGKSPNEEDIMKELKVTINIATNDVDAVLAKLKCSA